MFKLCVCQAEIDVFPCAQHSAAFIHLNGKVEPILILLFAEYVNSLKQNFSRE